MALMISFRYDGGNVRKIRIPNNRTQAVAQSLGWTTEIDDPAYQSTLDGLLAEFYALGANTPERAAKGAEIQALQQAGAAKVPNPQSDERFLMQHYQGLVRGTMIDQRAAQEAAQAELQAQIAALEAAADADLAPEDTVEP